MKKEIITTKWKRTTTTKFYRNGVLHAILCITKPLNLN